MRTLTPQAAPATIRLGSEHQINSREPARSKPLSGRACGGAGEGEALARKLCRKAAPAARAPWHGLTRVIRNGQAREMQRSH